MAKPGNRTNRRDKKIVRCDGTDYCKYNINTLAVVPLTQELLTSTAVGVVFCVYPGTSTTTLLYQV